ncbi:hypothetical protein FY050_12100 [Phyllobacterium endophyticum]|uniref:Peptidase S10 n=2 Tax=Phyllobacterium endophyticum TaxID=1149773 RepID=A0A2P7B0B9_9HYPH|nr:hypothetical protein CU100_03490 [Phyllobacterium endophyticum]TYR41984.1 hypothetical protein FY050_12100 [Phyllobacterium endophyticum]
MIGFLPIRIFHPMNFRFLLLFAVLGLSACNGSNSSSNDNAGTFDADMLAAQAKLDGLNSQISQKTAALTAAGAKLTATEQADAALGAKIKEGEDTLARLLDEARIKTKDVETASTKVQSLNQERADLEGPDGKIEKAKAVLADYEGAGATPGKIAKAKTELAGLEARLVKLKGDKTIKDQKDPNHIGSIKLAENERAAHTAELTSLIGDAKNPGKIKLAMDELARYVGENGLIETAKAELTRIDKLKTAAIADTEAAKLEAARIRSNALIETGQFAEAAKILDGAGLTAEGASLRTVTAFVKEGKTAEAAGELTKIAPVKAVAALYTRGGLDEEAYKLYAPADFKLEDTTTYDGSAGAQLAAAVDEKPSVKRHKMTLDGKAFWYTASAGHLTAFARNPQKEDPQASIFYTAYTRDDLPKADRPVTFFFNGGPGASSIYLHLASWAPKRAFLDGPKSKPEWVDNPPDSFDMIEDAESMIDKSDLVFVDVVPGTGYSQAIAPKKNHDFWGVTVDVELSRQFITRYVNAHKRQASPKYLYGESYGGGIRVPKLARALLEAGTSGYEKEASGVKPDVLTGVVFHSPAFDYSASDSEAMLPTTALGADYFNMTQERGDRSIDEYAQVLRDFMVKEYLPALKAGKTIDVSKYSGPARPAEFIHNSYDYRMYLRLETVPVTFMGLTGLMPVPLDYEFDFVEERAFNNVITDYLPRHVNYKTASPYINASWKDWFHPAEGAFESWNFEFPASGLPDIVAAIGIDPTIKLLTVHGYYDTVTPFYRSELSLKGVEIDPVKKTTLLDRIPVKNFAGGHMMYYSEEARAPMKKTLDEFYDAPPYGTGPTVIKAQGLVAAAPMQRAPVPAQALH